MLYITTTEKSLATLTATVPKAGAEGAKALAVARRSAMAERRNMLINV